MYINTYLKSKIIWQKKALSALCAMDRMVLIANAKETIKGIIIMKKINKFVTSLINNYCQYDDLSETYQIDIDDIDFDDLSKLCALIMQDNADLALEAVSIDNPAYETSMLPALNYYLANPSTSEIFAHEWQKGILSYLRNRIIALLDDACEIYNGDMAA